MAVRPSFAPARTWCLFPTERVTEPARAKKPAPSFRSATAADRRPRWLNARPTPAFGPSAYDSSPCTVAVSWREWVSARPASSLVCRVRARLPLVCLDRRCVLVRVTALEGPSTRPTSSTESAPSWRRQPTIRLPPPRPWREAALPPTVNTSASPTATEAELDMATDRSCTGCTCAGRRSAATIGAAAKPNTYDPRYATPTSRSSSRSRLYRSNSRLTSPAVRSGCPTSRPARRPSAPYTSYTSRPPRLAAPGCALVGVQGLSCVSGEGRSAVGRGR